MQLQTFIIKGMQAETCAFYVRKTLLMHNISWVEMEFGKVTLSAPLTEHKRQQLEQEFSKTGLALMDPIEDLYVSEVKKLIAKTYNPSEPMTSINNFSKLVYSTLRKDYRMISRRFKKYEGVSIQSYILQHKIRIAVSILLHENVSISDLSFRLGFSDPSHFCRYFKRFTNKIPSEIRATGCNTILYNLGQVPAFQETNSHNVR